MKYMAMIYHDEKAAATATPEQLQALFGNFMKFTAEVTASGQYQAGAPLQPSTTGTTVRVAQGKAVTTDGPFAETKEQLAGYYIFDCKDLDEAIELGGRICKLYTYPGSAVEIRPVRQMPS
jgi:hypothetical protein